MPRRSYERDRSRRNGRDAFGKFRITGGPCTNCGGDGSPTLCMCIHYSLSDLTLPRGIKPEDTILRHAHEDAYLGINCGCYAKLHRQVAHIQDKMRQRSSQSS